MVSGPCLALVACECDSDGEPTTGYRCPVSLVEAGGIRAGGVRPYFLITRHLPNNIDPVRPDSSKWVNGVIRSCADEVSLPIAVTRAVVASVLAFGSSSSPDRRLAVVAAPRLWETPTRLRDRPAPMAACATQSSSTAWTCRLAGGLRPSCHPSDGCRMEMTTSGVEAVAG